MKWQGRERERERKERPKEARALEKGMVNKQPPRGGCREIEQVLHLYSCCKFHTRPIRWFLFPPTGSLSTSLIPTCLPSCSPPSPPGSTPHHLLQSSNYKLPQCSLITRTSNCQRNPGTAILLFSWPLSMNFTIKMNIPLWKSVLPLQSVLACACPPFFTYYLFGPWIPRYQYVVLMHFM